MGTVIREDMPVGFTLKFVIAGIVSAFLLGAFLSGILGEVRLQTSTADQHAIDFEAHKAAMIVMVNGLEKQIEHELDDIKEAQMKVDALQTERIEYVDGRIDRKFDALREVLVTHIQDQHVSQN